MLTGDLPTAKRQSVVAALNGGRVKVLVATGQLIGEASIAGSFPPYFWRPPSGSTAGFCNTWGEY